MSLTLDRKPQPIVQWTVIHPRSSHAEWLPVVRKQICFFTRKFYHAANEYSTFGHAVIKTNDSVLRNNKTRWELFLIRIASVFPQICWKPCQLRPQSRCHCCVHQVAILSLSHFRYIPLCFWYALLRAFECCLQRPTVIISSRDNLWGKQLFNVMSYGDRKFCLLSFL